MAKYKLAKEFYLENGHLKVPSDYVTETGEKLGMWLGCQRQVMRGNPNYLMTEERKRLLDEIGMDWTLRRTDIKAGSGEGNKRGEKRLMMQMIKIFFRYARKQNLALASGKKAEGTAPDSA